jgi:hypothetical protein
MRSHRLARVLGGRRRFLVPTLCLLALVALPAMALAGESVKVFVMDRCEPDSFDAAVEPGTCVRNGGVKFDVFASQLNPQDGGHNAWRNSRTNMVLRDGQQLTLVNTGGEFHTFTEVANFGTGIVPPLNEALPPGTPAAVPVGPFNGMGAGDTLELDQLAPGTHLFECLIHPWMRTTVEQH